MHTPRFLALLLILASSGAAQRLTTELNTGWNFIRLDVGPAAEPDANWAPVTLPHTWNAIDGQNGKAADPKLPDGYYRGSGWYHLPLDLPTDLGDRRVIVRCEAVSQVADLYLNEHHVGQHRGAFTAFAVDLTPFLRPNGPNVLRIRADNSRSPDLAPITGDFTVFGGAYRPVHLVIVDPVHVSLQYHGSAGVLLTTRRLEATVAEVGVRTFLSNRLHAPASAIVETEISDDTGHVVARDSRVVPLPAGETLPVEQTLRVPDPRRWDGRRDPYLYRATVRIRREGRVVDLISQPLGVRTVAIDPQRGFLLNGEPYPIHGVSRHQDRLDRGWALSPAEQEEDLRIILEMGATAVRLAHYPQSEIIHAVADRTGLLLWEEIPNIERIPSLPAFAANLRDQFMEMMLQGYNHPALAFWGLFNEAKAVWLTPLGAPPEPLLNELRELAGQLDPSRPLVGASWLRHRDPLHDTVPHIAFNQYPGWKYDTPDEMGLIVDLVYENHGRRRIAIAEYGAGASIHHHLETGLARPPSTETPFHPEEWQAIVHEINWRHLKDNPRIWGTFAWVMFDFAADNRNEGDTPGRNDKGLVTADRQTRKDAYFFYQANWASAPMVHVTARRLDRRRLNPVAEVKAYSNCPEVELRVNGLSFGRVQPDEVAICRWKTVTLQPGANRVEVIARTADGLEVRDACSWFLETAP